MTSKQPVPPGVQPLGCREYMLTDGVAVKPHIEGEHVVQKIGHRRKGQVRRPFRLQEIQLRRRMRRQDRIERTEGCLRRLSFTATRVPARTAQRDVAESGAESQR